MILHIFKKDLRRLWPFVLGLVAACLVYAILQAGSGFLESEDTQRTRFALLGILGLVLVGLPFFLTVLLVQLDPIPDDRQDWLARPIRRWDLLLAKVVFVLVCIQGPLLVGDVIEGLALGFRLPQTLAVALSSNLFWLAVVTLPAMAIAALTRNLSQLLGLGLGVFGGVFAISVAVPFFFRPGIELDK